MTYAEKLKDPRWQKRRLELLEAADWTCRECGTKTKTLHVHHGYYKRATEPWNYPDEVMHVLCDMCHEEMQDIMTQVHENIGTFNKWEIFILKEFLLALDDFSRPGLLNVLTDTVLTANAAGLDRFDGIANGVPLSGDEFDHQWLQKAALLAALNRSEMDGFKRGKQFAEAKAATQPICEAVH